MSWFHSAPLQKIDVLKVRSITSMSCFIFMLNLSKTSSFIDDPSRGWIVLDLFNLVTSFHISIQGIWGKEFWFLLELKQ